MYYVECLSSQFNDLQQSGNRVGMSANCGILIPLYSSSSVEFLLLKENKWLFKN